MNNESDKNHEKNTNIHATNIASKIHSMVYLFKKNYKQAMKREKKKGKVNKREKRDSDLTF